MESDGKNSSTLTVLAPLASVVGTTSNDSNVAATNNTPRNNGGDLVLNGDTANRKSELSIESEQKSLIGINIYQLPVVVPLETVNAVTASDLLQMSSSVVGVPVQRHSFMTAVGSDVVSCSDGDVDQRSMPQQLSPHHQNQPQQSHHQVVNSAGYDASVGGGRMSPPCYPGSSTYATLTPFQPLPPISTVSDKFNGGGNGMGFVFMQNHTPANDLGPYGDGSDVYSSYKYNEKDVSTAEMSNGDSAINCNSFESSQNGIAMVMNGSGYLLTQQPANRNFQSPYSVYGHATQDNQPLPVKSEMNGAVTLASVDSLSSYDNIATIYTSNLMSASSVQPKSIPATTVSLNIGSLPMSLNSTVSTASLISHRSSTGTDMHCQLRVGSPDQPSSSTDMRGCDDDTSSTPADGSGGEEINTRDVALRVSNELKKYSIPQAVFAQRVLGRSQGTLSDLLRNPKPWSKLKSGRETFRRMWKWLQEPEYQRMAALRIPGPGKQFEKYFIVQFQHHSN
jgi:CUT domain